MSAHTDLSIVPVGTAPSPADSGTTVVVTDANAALLPDVYPWWGVFKPAGAVPTRANCEQVKVTAGSSSGGNTTYTIERAKGNPVTTARSVLVGDDFYEGVAAQDIIDIENAAMGMARQALINGNFDIWQRAVTSTNPAAPSFIADRWKLSSDAGGGAFPTNTIHSRQAITPGDLPNSFYMYRINPDGAGTSLGASSRYWLQQHIEHGTRNLAGASRKVTLTFWAKSTIASKKIGAFLIQNYGSGGSPTSDEYINGSNITLTSSWQKFTVTFTLNTLAGKTFGTNLDDALILNIGVMWGSSNAAFFGAGSAETFVGSGNIEIAQVQLSATETSLPFQPQSFDDELRRCQRYFEKSYKYAVLPGATISAGNDTEAMNVGANTTSRLSLARRFRVMKRATPTFVVYDWAGNSGKIDELSTSDAATDNISPTYTLGEQNGFYVSHNPSTKAGIAFAWTADAEL